MPSPDLDKLKADAAAGFPLHDDDRDALIDELERLRGEVAQLNKVESDIEKDWHAINAYLATAVGPNDCHSAYEMVDALVARVALAAPIPPAKLRPMSEAPRDGKPFLIYDKRLRRVKIACLVGSDPARWRVSDDTDRYSIDWLEEDFLGWRPLPEVQL